MLLKLKKYTIPVLLIMIFSIFTLVFSKKSYAQVFVPTHDSITNAAISGLLVTNNLYAFQTSFSTGLTAAKEFGFQAGMMNPAVSTYTTPGGAVTSSMLSVDFIATLMAKQTLNLMTQSIVGWINSGFSGGGPGFVKDPAEFFLNVADTTAGQFIQGSELGFLCSPFSADIRALLNYNYSVSFDVSCTLSQVLNNIDNFTKFTSDFSQGGWTGWFQIIQPQNNTYGSYLKAEAGLYARIGNKVLIDKKLLDWGDGFFSSQDCIDPPGATLDKCKTRGPIKTPGKTIETGLSDTLGINLTQIGFADSMDKILNALINYAITTALGPGGLGSL